MTHGSKGQVSPSLGNYVLPLKGGFLEYGVTKDLTLRLGDLTQMQGIISSNVGIVPQRQVPNPLFFYPTENKEFALGYAINTSNLIFPKSNLPFFPQIHSSLSVNDRESI